MLINFGFNVGIYEVLMSWSNQASVQQIKETMELAKTLPDLPTSMFHHKWWKCAYVSCPLHPLHMGLIGANCVKSSFLI